MNKDIIENFKTYLFTEKYLVDNSVESYYLDIKCYLEYIGGKYKCKIRVGGHSKGGNLAIYSASFITLSTISSHKIHFPPLTE